MHKEASQKALAGQILCSPHCNDALSIIATGICVDLADCFLATLFFVESPNDVEENIIVNSIVLSMTVDMHTSAPCDSQLTVTNKP